MELKIKGKLIEIKFDYRLMFKIDRKLATKNAETGERNKDGVGAFFNKILNHDDDGIIDLIKMVSGTNKKECTDEDALETIEAWIEENEVDSTDKLFEEIKDEMVESGFFKEKILKYISNMKKAVSYMEAKEEMDDVQIKSLQDLITEMENAVS